MRGAVQAVQVVALPEHFAQEESQRPQVVPRSVYGLLHEVQVVASPEHVAQEGSHRAQVVPRSV